LAGDGNISGIDATTGVNIFSEVGGSDWLKRLCKARRDSEDSSDGYRGASSRR
jgi:hypothetical protein